MQALSYDERLVPFKPPLREKAVSDRCGEPASEQLRDLGRTVGDRDARRPRSVDLALRVPKLPEMIAPAWPSDFPGGALRPPTNATTGNLGRCSAMNAAASSSSEPPISPQMTIAFVCGSFANSRRQSTKVVPMIGSPPMPDAGGLAEARARQTVDDLVRQRARARDQPDAAFLEDMSRHDADEPLARRDQTRAVRPDDPHARRRADDLEHVVHRDALGDADRRTDPRVVRLVERVGGERRRNENARVSRAGGGDGRFDGVEDRQPCGRLLPALARASRRRRCSCRT